jgi:hypothetical protein
VRRAAGAIRAAVHSDKPNHVSRMPAQGLGEAAVVGHCGDCSPMLISEQHGSDSDSDGPAQRP